MSILKCENVWKFLTKYNLEFEHDLPVDLKCVICHRVLVNAHQGPCSCRFCWECISDYLKQEERFCPGELDDCKEFLINLNKDIQIDYAINRSISNLKVKCPNQCCEKLIELRNLEEHMKLHIVRCPFYDLGCNGSQSTLDNIKHHLIIDNYSHTDLLLKRIDNLTKELNFVRIKLKSIEENLTENDKFKFDMKQIVNSIHVNLGEQNQEIAHIKADIGQLIINNLQSNDQLGSSVCQLKPPDGNIDRNQNFGIAFDDIKGNKNSSGDIAELSSIKNELDLYKNEHRKLFDEMESRKSEIRIIDENLQMKQKLILKLETRLEKLQIENEPIEKERKNLLNANTETNKELIQNMIKKFIQEFSEPQTPPEISKIFSEIFYDNKEDSPDFLRQTTFFEENYIENNFSPFNWKINNFSKKWKLSRDGIDQYIMSNDFYSHKNGYKLILGIYPDGFDTEQGTFLSIFFHIAKGEHDNNLPWPMKNEISISLINQETNHPHTTEKFKFDTAEKSFLPSYYQPQTALNLGYGDTQFINLLTLFNDPTILKNDCIIIRCSVETN